MWGVIWLVIAFIFFISGVLVGIVAFKVCYSRKQTLRYIAVLAWGNLAHICMFCRNRRLNNKKMRSTFCPLPGRTAPFRCRYRHRLYYYSAPCHLHYSVCYDYQTWHSIFARRAAKRYPGVAVRIDLAMYTITFNRTSIVVVVISFVCIRAVLFMIFLWKCLEHLLYVNNDRHQSTRLLSRVPVNLSGMIDWS